jgi:D-serine deaminase-like pyridoxal phosphate-dependent protein
MTNQTLKDSIVQPSLLVDSDKAMRNLHRMLRKASQHELALRPHFKTHQSAEMGHWFREAGIDRIAVSSVRMAQYFAGVGWNDILIAFPCNLRMLPAIESLSHAINLQIMIDNAASAAYLAEHTNTPLFFRIEINAGYHRCGVHFEDQDSIDQILQAAQQSGKLFFQGFYIHSGHSYKAAPDQLASIHTEALQALQALKQIYSPHYPNLSCYTGDTPLCSTADYFGGIDEITPGNFFFYDVMQYHIGSCNLDDIAIALAAPVVSIYPERNEAIVHGGAVHLSKDSIQPDGKQQIFGYLATLDEDLRWHLLPEDNYVKSISQEHGILKLSNQVLTQLTVGDLLAILPVHSCLCADLMGGYLNINDGKFIAMMKK